MRVLVVRKVSLVLGPPRETGLVVLLALRYSSRPAFQSGISKRWKGKESAKRKDPRRRLLRRQSDGGQMMRGGLRR